MFTLINSFISLTKCSKFTENITSVDVDILNLRYFFNIDLKYIKKEKANWTWRIKEKKDSTILEKVKKIDAFL